MEKLETIQQFASVVNSGESLFVMKHSITCPISGAAFEEYDSFEKEVDGVLLYYLTVQGERELSNYIESQYGIKHESPQAILFKNGQAVWNASHWKINVRSLRNALSEE